jgi:hypothetical protein
MNKNIPEIINNFNAYHKGSKLIGVTSEVTLPEMEQMAETISMAGMLGEIESSAIGHFGAMEQEVPFQLLTEDIFSSMSPLDGVSLTLRGSEQVTDPSTGAKKFTQIRVVEKGTFKSFNAGSLKKGGAGNPTVKFGLTYILIEIGGKPKFELDKLNNVFKVNGKDILKNITKQC